MPVNVTGVKELQAAMKILDPNLNKEMQTEIKNAMIPIRDQAKSYMPANNEVLSGWRKVNVTAEQKYPPIMFELMRNHFPSVNACSALNICQSGIVDNCFPCVLSDER